MNYYLIHVLFWAAVALCATQFGGSFTVFNCWQIGALFPGPVAVIFWSIMAGWVILAIVQTSRFIASSDRRTARLPVPIHLLIFIAGLSLETVIAHRWYPRVSCL